MLAEQSMLKPFWKPGGWKLYFFPRVILYNFFLFWLIYGGLGFWGWGFQLMGFGACGVGPSGFFWVGALLKIKEKPWEKNGMRYSFIYCFTWL